MNVLISHRVPIMGTVMAEDPLRECMMNSAKPCVAAENRSMKVNWNNIIGAKSKAMKMKAAMPAFWRFVFLPSFALWAMEILRLEMFC